MRHTFQNHVLDFSRYDQSFPDVLTGESDKNICRIAMNRLRWPIGLQNQPQTLYEEALLARLGHLLRLLTDTRDLAGLEFFCRSLSLSKGDLSGWMESCIQAQWGEGAAYLADQIRATGSFARKTFSFDDF